MRSAQPPGRVQARVGHLCLRRLDELDPELDMRAGTLCSTTAPALGALFVGQGRLARAQPHECCVIPVLAQ